MTSLILILIVYCDVTSPAQHQLTQMKFEGFLSGTPSVYPGLVRVSGVGKGIRGWRGYPGLVRGYPGLVRVSGVGEGIRGW